MPAPRRTRAWRRTSATASSPPAATWGTTAARTLSQAFYDQPVAHSYFEGCSNGGRQAMMMAQNYPELFDGIVAGAPSMFYPDILFWLIYTGKVLQPVLGQQALSATKRSLITQRVLDACDANDGL